MQRVQMQLAAESIDKCKVQTQLVLPQVQILALIPTQDNDGQQETASSQSTDSPEYGHR